MVFDLTRKSVRYCIRYFEAPQSPENESISLPSVIRLLIRRRSAINVSPRQFSHSRVIIYQVCDIRLPAHNIPNPGYRHLTRDGMISW